MEKQKILGKEVLQDVTLQKDLKEIKEALEIQRLKEEIICRILFEKNREVLQEIEEFLNPPAIIPEKDMIITPMQGNG